MEKSRSQGVYRKYRISKKERASKFIEATVYFQDDVYQRTCDIQDTKSLCEADLLCHKRCINRYLIEFERANCEVARVSVNKKKEAWLDIIGDIETRLSNDEGVELSYVRNCLNEKMNSDTITNKEVKLLLISHFGDNIKFTLPKQKNRSMLFFSADVTQESLAEKIRAADPIQGCAKVIRQSLIAVDFDLQDRFCDANDLKRAWNCTAIPDPLLKFFGIPFQI